MPESNLQTFQYDDERLRLTVSAAAGRTVGVYVADDGMAVHLTLTVVGAQRLATMLGSAITVAITRGGAGGDR